VRQHVIAATDRQQVPWDHSSLTGDFFFLPPAPVPTVATPPADTPTVDTALGTPTPGPEPRAGITETELVMWETIQTITVSERQVEALNLYLSTYPQGRFAGLAEIQIAALTSPTLAPQPDPAVEPTTPSVPRQPLAPGPADLERALGLSRDNRRAVQSALTLLGYDTRGVDGVFGGNTRRALRDYQQARGQSVTGYLTAETMTALIAAANVTSDSANTCQWAFDGECDEARYQGNSTDACTAGTDTFDCQGRVLRNAASTTSTGDSCEWARDGECDESRYAGNATSLCNAGTDTTDCRGYALRSADPSNSCEWAYDGECDEQRYQGAASSACSAGTDAADCRGYSLVGSNQSDPANSCQWAFDGECDEGRYYGNATNACPHGSDTYDCRTLRLR